MSKKDVIEVEGTVIDAMPNTIFKVKLANGHEITYLSAKDPDRNAVSVPRSMCSGNKGTMVYSDEKGKMVIVKGLEDYLVVDTDDVLLICPRNPKQIQEILTNIAMPDCEDYR